MNNSFKAWAVKVIGALFALATAIGAIIGAWFAFTPAVFGDTNEGRLPFVALALAATFIGVPALAKWVNDRLIRTAAKILKS